MKLFYKPDDKLDLFDLVPFSSDIDLEHSGKPEKTAEIHYHIEQRVPFASWFRWSIIDQEQAKAAARNRAVSTYVPLRRIRFSSRGDALIPTEAMSDLSQRRVSFTRNPAYRDSRPSLDRLDVELYGLMLALNVAAELKDIAGKSAKLRNDATAREWLAGPANKQLADAAKSPRLVARFWHLLAPQLARRGENGYLQKLVGLAAEAGMLKALNIEPNQLGPEQTFSVSRFSGKGFRVSELAPKIVTGQEALGCLSRIISERRSSLKLASTSYPQIDPAFDLVAVVPHLTVRPYVAQDALPDDGFYSDVTRQFSDAQGKFSGVDGEFMEITWHQPNGLAHNPRGLTAQFIPRTNVAASAGASALPAVGGVFHNGRPWVRARIDALLDRRPGASGSEAALVILQANNG